MWFAVIALQVALGRARDHLKAALARSAENEQRASELKRSALNAERDLNDLKTALAAVKKAPSNETAAKPVKKLRPYWELLKDPKLQVALLAAKRSEARRHYSALFHQLHLNATEIAQFEELLAHRDEALLDAQALAREGRTGVDTGRMFTDIGREFKAGEEALLGPDGFAQAGAYERLGGARDLVNAYNAGAVTVAGAPITPDQGEQLIQAIANASPSYRAGGEIYAGEIDWSAVEAKAATFLSPAQLDLIESMEPPLPSGARYQTQLYNQVDQAQQQEKSAAATAKE